MYIKPGLIFSKLVGGWTRPEVHKQMEEHMREQLTLNDIAQKHKWGVYRFRHPNPELDGKLFFLRATPTLFSVVCGPIVSTPPHVLFNPIDDPSIAFVSSADGWFDRDRKTTSWRGYFEKLPAFGVSDEENQKTIKIIGTLQQLEDARAEIAKLRVELGRLKEYQAAPAPLPGPERQWIAMPPTPPASPIHHASVDQSWSTVEECINRPLPEREDIYGAMRYWDSDTLRKKLVQRMEQNESLRRRIEHQIYHIKILQEASGDKSRFIEELMRQTLIGKPGEDLKREMNELRLRNAELEARNSALTMENGGLHARVIHAEKVAGFAYPGQGLPKLRDDFGPATKGAFGTPIETTSETYDIAGLVIDDDLRPAVGGNIAKGSRVWLYTGNAHLAAQAYKRTCDQLHKQSTADQELIHQLTKEKGKSVQVERPKSELELEAIVDRLRTMYRESQEWAQQTWADLCQTKWEQTGDVRWATPDQKNKVMSELLPLRRENEFLKNKVATLERMNESLRRQEEACAERAHKAELSLKVLEAKYSILRDNMQGIADDYSDVGHRFMARCALDEVKAITEDTIKAKGKRMAERHFGAFGPSRTEEGL